MIPKLGKGASVRLSSFGELVVVVSISDKISQFLFTDMHDEMILI